MTDTMNGHATCREADIRIATFQGPERLTRTWGRVDRYAGDTGVVLDLEVPDDGSGPGVRIGLIGQEGRPVDVLDAGGDKLDDDAAEVVAWEVLERFDCVLEVLTDVEDEDRDAAPVP